MAEVIRMPRMSDTMTEGVFVAWNKKVGDTVKPGDILAEVETDKATMDLENYDEGTLLYIGVKPGEAAPVDSIIAIIGEKGEDFKDLLEAEKKADEASEKAEAPEEKEDVEAPVEQKQEKAASKTPTPVEAPKAPESTPKAESRDNSNGRIKASPLARRLAEEKGLEISNIPGSGDGGRIIKRDVESYTPAASEKSASTVTIPVFTGEESYQEQPVSQMRKIIATRLAESKFGAPHFYLTIDINMDRVMEARKSLNEFSEQKISFNDIIVKAVAASLRRHPAVNSSWRGNAIRYNEHIHIGVAVAVEDGLIVPVIRFADGKSLSHISAETRDLAEKARNRKLQPEDWSGNTFTISNLGMFGIEEFTAIINPPDACILAIGGIRQEPVVENGEIRVGNRMKVTMSCDHRVVDGATGAKFLQSFKAMMEEPLRILA